MNMSKLWLRFLMGIAALALVGQAPILAMTESDDHLARRVERVIVRYAYFTVFDDVDIDVGRDGRIILRGHVTSPHKRTDLMNRVLAVDGVDEVQNDLEVLPVSRFDNELRYRVARSIYGSSTFWHYAARRNPPIHIVVKNRHVTLTGVVTNELVRLSDVPTWEPIELFNESAHYQVKPTLKTPVVASE